MELHPDFSEFLKLLQAHGIRFVVIGGYAVWAHGHVRYTGDIDVFYDAEALNAERLQRALDEFGLAGITARQLMTPNTLFRFGVKPVMIELMNEISGVSFEDVYTHRIEAEFGGLRVPMIDLKRLRQNKLASGRPKDLADLSQLPDAP